MVYSFVYCSRVFFKTNDSIMVRNFRDNNCIAVAGEVVLGKTRLFSLNRHGIKVHHTAYDSMNVEIIKTYPSYQRV